MKKLLFVAVLCFIALLSRNIEWFVWLWEQAERDPLKTAAEISTIVTVAAIIVGLISWLHQQNLRKHPFHLMFITCRQDSATDTVTTNVAIQNQSDITFKVFSLKILKPYRYYIRGKEDGSEAISKTGSILYTLFGGSKECAAGTHLQISDARLTEAQANHFFVPDNNLNIITDKGDITLKLIRPEFSRAEAEEPTYTLVAYTLSGHWCNRMRASIGKRLSPGRARHWLLKTG